MPFPSTCQSPVTCDNRPSRKVGETWLCLACFEYTEHHKHLPIPEEPMSQTIPDQILAHMQTRPVVTNSELQAALGVPKSSISSALATLRSRGIVAPSDGTGTVRLVAPVSTTTPDEDTVQTSEADVLRAEIGRLTERLSSAVEESMQRAKDLEITREKLRKCQHYSATADSVMEQMRRAAQKERTEIIDALGMDPEAVRALVEERDMLREQNARTESHLRGELETALDKIAALKHGPAVRLEWSPWEEAESGVDTHLWLRIGQIEASIVHIESDLGIKATLFYSDEIGGTTAQIRGMKPEDVAAPLSVLLTAAGLTMPPIPALPESA